MRTKHYTLATVFVLTAGISQAGTFTFDLWFDDSDLSFIGNTTHTHAAEITTTGNLGTVTPAGGASINGVDFDALEGAGGFNSPATWTNANLSLSGGDWAFSGSAIDNGSSIIGTASTDFVTGLTASTTVTMQLHGLAANTDYTFYYFSPVFGSEPVREGTLETSFDDFANIEDTSSTVNQATASGFDQIVSYTYNTGSNTSIYIRTVSNTAGENLHTYGFYNAEAVVVPEPTSTALLGLGGVALLLRRRK